MKPHDALFEAVAAPGVGRGWRVFVDAMVVDTRIGIHAHEHGAAQPLVLDASLVYRATPDEHGDHSLIDYECYCERITKFLMTKPHTRLLETLALELAVLSFSEFAAIDALTLVLHKPKIRSGTRRIGVEFDWTRKDYLRWLARRNGTSASSRVHDACLLSGEYI
ncbi:dihydroneopterin aldolase [Paraburkholderia tropica]|uniref:dihydroneopterin aldolase n=1 Tax=Paraburkholderia tropica TaxID=92647 RepID=UPI002AB671C6|nr:dihydroneopterin aldolase [Paraburkholderia tropica]